MMHELPPSGPKSDAILGVLGESSAAAGVLDLYRAIGTRRDRLNWVMVWTPPDGIYVPK
jgi:hypothetical protein